MATLPEVAPPPAWVDGGASPITGLDLLGLRAPVQAIGNTLLSGVTTISPTVRYVSLYAWIARRYAEARLPDSWDSFREFAGRVEAAVAVGNLVVDRQTAGLAGKDPASRLVDAGEDPIELKPLIGQLAVSAYGGPAGQLRVSFSRDSGVPGLTEERGLRLALAVEGTLGVTQFAQALGRSPMISSVSREVLTEVGARFLIGSPAEDERVLLLEAILPAQPRGADEVSRLATYGILLDLCEARGRRTREEDLFEAAIAPASPLPEFYRPYLDGWIRYLVRDMIAVVHEAALAAVIDEMASTEAQPAPHRAQDVMSALLGRQDELEEPLRTLGLLPAGDAPLDQPLHVLEAVVRETTQPRTFPPIPRWKGLAEPAVIALAPASGAGRLSLLPIAWLLARERLGESLAPDVGVEPRYWGWGRMGIDEVILPGLQDMLRRRVTIRSAIHELALRSVEQHLRVAWSRMAAEPHKDVAVLSSDADTWYFRKRFRAGRTASRLPQAIGWLSQLGLLIDAGCSEDGRRHLARIRSTLEAIPSSS